MRQLRYNTRNTLQRIVCLITDSPNSLPMLEYPNNLPMLEYLAFSQDLVRRICLSMDIADSLFGVSQPFGSVEQRLLRIATGLASSFANSEHAIEMKVAVEGECPASLIDLVLQIAFELVGAAVRCIARGAESKVIGIKLGCARGGPTVLTVMTDQMAYCRSLMGSEGLELVEEIAALRGGKVSLHALPFDQVVVKFS